MELVEHNAGVGRVLLDRVAERPPHVHHCQFNASALFRPQIGEELVDIRFAAAAAAKPDGSAAFQIADYHAVVVALVDGDLVATDGDRKSVGWGKSVSVRVDLGGRRILNKK